MSLPTSILSYAPEFGVLDRAIESKKGIRLEFETERQAFAFRFRLNYARSLEREKNKSTCQPGDPLYGTTEYDCLTCRIYPGQEDNWWIYIEKNETFGGLIQEIE